ncbi:hypothetical protein ACFRDV_35860 [Streptomyces fagopyri]|uniref:hypothetical protein n=1 Tax=Streptomyces fagopyri TaxID=2662397 RepID=UPI0036948B9C
MGSFDVGASQCLVEDSTERGRLANALLYHVDECWQADARKVLVLLALGGGVLFGGGGTLGGVGGCTTMARRGSGEVLYLSEPEAIECPRLRCTAAPTPGISMNKPDKPRRFESSWTDAANAGEHSNS